MIVRSNRFKCQISSVICAGLVLTMSVPALGQSTRTADACTRISPAVLDSYANEIGVALRWATADASKNGAAGQYAVAATNSRDLLGRAHQKAISGAADLRHADPSVTTYAEAGTIKEHVRAILEVVPQAAHWSMISSIYHNSLMQITPSKALEYPVVLRKKAGNIYIDSEGTEWAGPAHVTLESYDADGILTGSFTNVSLPHTEKTLPNVVLSNGHIEVELGRP